MPIYEYYCGKCHTLLNFFSRRLNPEGSPRCPHCGARRLARQVSLFAAGRKGDGNDGLGEDGDLPVDEQKMERAIEALASEAEGMNEEDPKAAATLMRKFSKAAGMEFNEGIEQAIRRLESGEDPETIEADMGSTLDDADPFVPAGHHGRGQRVKGGEGPRGVPRRDGTLYDF